MTRACGTCSPTSTRSPSKSLTPWAPLSPPPGTGSSKTPWPSRPHWGLGHSLMACGPWLLGIAPSGPWGSEIHSGSLMRLGRATPGFLLCGCQSLVILITFTDGQVRPTLSLRTPGGGPFPTLYRGAITRMGNKVENVEKKKDFHCRGHAFNPWWGN